MYNHVIPPINYRPSADRGASRNRKKEKKHMDQLIIKANAKTKSELRKPLMINANNFEKIQKIAEETGYSKGALGDLLVEFALKHLNSVAT